MALRYIPDELISRISASGVDIQKFIRESIEEKLQRLGELNERTGTDRLA